MEMFYQKCKTAVYIANSPIFTSTSKLYLFKNNLRTIRTYKQIQRQATDNLQTLHTKIAWSARSSNLKHTCSSIKLTRINQHTEQVFDVIKNNEH